MWRIAGNSKWARKGKWLKHNNSLLFHLLGPVNFQQTFSMLQINLFISVNIHLHHLRQSTVNDWTSVGTVDALQISITIDMVAQRNGWCSNQRNRMTKNWKLGTHFELIQNYTAWCVSLTPYARRYRSKTINLWLKESKKMRIVSLGKWSTRFGDFKTFDC